MGHFRRLVMLSVGMVAAGIWSASAAQAADCPVPAAGQILSCTKQQGSDAVSSSVILPGVTTGISTGGPSATLDVLVELAGGPSDPQPTTTITRHPGAPAALPVSVEILIGLPGGVVLRHGYDARTSNAPQSAQLSFPVMQLASSQLALQAVTATGSPLTLTAGVGDDVKLSANLPQPVPTFQMSASALPKPAFAVSGTGVFDATVSAQAGATVANLGFDDLAGQGQFTLSGPHSFSWQATGPAKQVSAVVSAGGNRVQAILQKPPTKATFTLGGGALTYSGAGALPGFTVDLRSATSMSPGTMYLRYIKLTGKQMPVGTSIDTVPDANGMGLNVPGGQAVGELKLVAEQDPPVGPGGNIVIDPGPVADFGIPAKPPVVLRMIDPLYGKNRIEMALYEMRRLRLTTGAGAAVQVVGGQGRRLVLDVDASDYDTMSISSDAATPQAIWGKIDTLPGSLTVTSQVGRITYLASAPVARLELTRDDRRTYDARDVDVRATGLPTAFDAKPIPAGGFLVDTNAKIGTFSARISSDRKSKALGFAASEDGLRLLDTPQRFETSVRATGLKRVSVATAAGVKARLEHKGGRDLLVTAERRRPSESRELVAQIRAKSVPAVVDVQSAGKGIRWLAAGKLPLLSAVVDRREGLGADSRRILRAQVKQVPASWELQAGSSNKARLTTSSPIGRLRVRSGGAEVDALPAMKPADLLVRQVDTETPGVSALLRGLRSFQVERHPDGQARFEVATTSKRKTVLRNTSGAKAVRITVGKRPARMEVGVVPDKGSTGGLGNGKPKVIGKKVIWRASAAIKRITVAAEGIDLLKKRPGDEKAELTLRDLPKKVQLRFTKRIELASPKPVSLEGTVRTAATAKVPVIALKDAVDGLTLYSEHVDGAPVMAMRMQLRGLRGFSADLSQPAIQIKRDKDRPLLVHVREIDKLGRLAVLRKVAVDKVPSSLRFSLDSGSVTRARYAASAPIDSLLVDVRNLATAPGAPKRSGLYLDIKDIPKKFDVCWDAGGRKCAPVYGKAKQLKGNLDFDLLMSKDPISMGSFELNSDGSRTMKLDAELCTAGGRCSYDESGLKKGVRLKDTRIPQRLAFEAHFERNSFLIGQISSGKTRPVQGWLYLDTDNDKVSTKVTLAQYNKKVKELRIATGAHQAQDYVTAFTMYSYLQPATWRSRTTGSWKCSGSPSVEVVVGVDEVKLLKALSSLILSNLC